MQRVDEPAVRFGDPVLHRFELARATRRGAAPRVGMFAWVAAMGSAVLSWALAGFLLTADLVRGWGQLDQLLAGCFATLGWVH